MDCDCNNNPSQNSRNEKAEKGTFIQLINKKIGKPTISDASPIISNGETHQGKCPPETKLSGNFVPLIQNNIDLASSTHVNSPIIPLIKPEECILKNKKYQVMISFDKDINGQIYPEWMREPLINALGDPYKKIIDDISGYIALEVDTATTSAIHKAFDPLDGKLNTLSSRFDRFIVTPATISSLGLVKGSDRINQISVLNDGTMEVNGVELSRISQDVDLILYSPSIEQNPTGEDFISCDYLSAL